MSLEFGLWTSNFRFISNFYGIKIRRLRIASDDSFTSDEGNLDRNLLKHQAFMAEIHSNSGQMSNIQRVRSLLKNYSKLFFF